MLFNILKSVNILSDILSLNIADINNPTKKYINDAIDAAIKLDYITNFFLFLLFNSYNNVGIAV